MKLEMEFTAEGDTYPSRSTTVTIPLTENTYAGPIPTRIKEMNKVLGGASSSDTVAQSLAGAMHNTFVMYDDSFGEVCYLSEISAARTVVKQEEVVYSG